MTRAPAVKKLSPDLWEQFARGEFKPDTPAVDIGYALAHAADLIVSRLTGIDPDAQASMAEPKLAVGASKVASNGVWASRSASKTRRMGWAWQELSDALDFKYLPVQAGSGGYTQVAIDNSRFVQCSPWNWLRGSRASTPAIIQRFVSIDYAHSAAAAGEDAPSSTANFQLMRRGGMVTVANFAAGKQLEIPTLILETNFRTLQERMPGVVGAMSVAMTEALKASQQFR